jgi:hypothetical protein
MNMDNIPESTNFVQKILTRAQGVAQRSALIPISRTTARPEVSEEDPFEATAAWEATVPDPSAKQKAPSPSRPFPRMTPLTVDAAFHSEFSQGSSRISGPFAPKIDSWEPTVIRSEMSGEVPIQNQATLSSEKIKEFQDPVAIEPRSLRAAMKNDNPVSSFIPRAKENIDESFSSQPTMEKKMPFSSVKAKKKATLEKGEPEQIFEESPTREKRSLRKNRSSLTLDSHAEPEIKPTRKETKKKEILGKFLRPETVHSLTPEIKHRVFPPIVGQKSNSISKTSVPNLRPNQKPEAIPVKSKSESGPRLIIDRMRVEVIPTAPPARTVVVRPVSTPGSQVSRRPVSQLRFGLRQL